MTGEELRQLESLLGDLMWEVNGNDLDMVYKVKMIVESKIDDLDCDD